MTAFYTPEMEDNSIKLEKDLKDYLYQLRIEAEVFIEEMVKTHKMCIFNQNFPLKYTKCVYFNRYCYEITQKFVFLFRKIVIFLRTR